MTRVRTYNKRRKRRRTPLQYLNWKTVQLCLSLQVEWFFQESPLVKYLEHKS